MEVNLNLSPRETYVQPKGKHLVISGPCAVETPDQIYEVVKQLAESGQVDVVRGGIWKPRTRPNSFEGVGEAGLPWFKESCRAFGLPCMAEVAKAEHVEEALRHNINMLWIGARTTVNPFAVQEIADALQGVDVPVWVKNPVNPDLGLWVGALERLNQAGITKLGAIHRGFSPMGESLYRNEPHWPMALQLRDLLPQLPIVADPSHMAGRRDLLERLAHKALALGMDGLMIECHPNPDEAWSDAKQQITPAHLAQMLEGLMEIPAKPEEAVPLQQLQEIIAGLDQKLAQVKALVGIAQSRPLMQLLSQGQLSIN